MKRLLVILSLVCLALTPVVYARMSVGVLGGGVTAGGGATDYTTDENLEAYWYFEDTIGSGDPFDDNHVNGNDLSIEDSTTPTRSSTQKVQGSYAAHFDQADWDRIACADADLSAGFPGKDTGGHYGSITFGGWFYIDDITNSQSLIGKRAADEGDCYWLLFDTTADKIIFRVSHNGHESTSVTSTTALSADTWYFIAGVFDDSNNWINVYIGTAGVSDDGFDATQVAFTFSLYDACAQAFSVGYVNVQKTLEGYADMCFVFSRALSAAELDEIRGNGLDGQGY